MNSTNNNPIRLHRREIEHIHYGTLAAMVEGSGVTNNSYTILDIHSDGTIHLRGFRRQKNYDWS